MSLAASAAVTMTGSNDRLGMAGDTNATVTGTGDTVDVTGTGVKLSINNATIYVESGADVAVTGTGDTIIHGSPPATTPPTAAPSTSADATPTFGGTSDTTPQTSSSEFVAPESGRGTSGNAVPPTVANDSPTFIPRERELLNDGASHTATGAAVRDVSPVASGTHLGASGTPADVTMSGLFDQLAGAISGALRDGSISPILLPSFNEEHEAGVSQPTFANVLLPQAQQLINAMASFAPHDAAPTTAMGTSSGGMAPVLAPNLHH